MSFRISNAYLKTTKKGSKVYRIMVDTDTILSHLEQGESIIGIDITTNHGLVKTIRGKNRNTGALWEALQYYIWAKIPTEQKEAVSEAVKNATPALQTA
jgi:hypothetical protein